MNIQQKMFDELVVGLLNIYHEQALEIILFGSVARGSYTEESDIDIAFIITYETRQQHEKMLDLVTELDLKYDQVISVITIEKEKYTIWGEVSPFYKNVRKDGIYLWKAA